MKFKKVTVRISHTFRPWELEGEEFEVEGHNFKVEMFESGELYFVREDDFVWPVTPTNLELLESGASLSL